ncbi:hypothetical protein BHE74_00042726 [Ensete ventricosum]|nr:hypothetical protein BHE74_00042726 [Ensete ventricosum]RZS01308.1 hypothetical protein BHM03_00031147 [Ensete ventricosum]
MPPRRFAFGRAEDAVHPDTIRAALSEFIATALFVFAAEGSVLSLGKLYKDTSTAGGLVVVAIAHALALSVAVSVAFNISGGHVNPAVTLGALVGGRISLLHAVFYWVAQLLGAVVAALLLRLATGGMVTNACKSTVTCHSFVYGEVVRCMCSRHAEAAGIRGGVGRQRGARRPAGDRNDVRARLHRVCDGDRPQERPSRHHRASRHRLHPGRQHPCRRAIRRRRDEPRAGLRTGSRRLEVEEPLGVLGWPLGRSSSGRAYL